MTAVCGKVVLAVMFALFVLENVVLVPTHPPSHTYTHPHTLAVMSALFVLENVVFGPTFFLTLPGRCNTPFVRAIIAPWA